MPLCYPSSKKRKTSYRQIQPCNQYSDMEYMCQDLPIQMPKKIFKNHGKKQYKENEFTPNANHFVCGLKLLQKKYKLFGEYPHKFKEMDIQVGCNK